MEQASAWMVVTIVVVSAAVAWGITEAVRRTALAYVRSHTRLTEDEAKRRLWWAPMLAILSILLGFGVGCALGAVDWSAIYGGAFGALGGALATSIVAAVKGNLTAALKRLMGGDK